MVFWWQTFSKWW